MTKQLRAEIEDPTTGTLTPIEADTQDELDQLIDAHLEHAFPDAEPE